MTAAIATPPPMAMGMLDLASHDRHPHEAVPRPKEDGGPGEHAEQSLVAEDGVRWLASIAWNDAPP
jgi:hypothetical protein